MLLLIGLLLVVGCAVATDFSDQTISTDRPGIPYSTSIVPAGHLQLETGLPTFDNDPLPDGHSLLLSAPTYLRYGVTDDFEVQLASSPWNRLTRTQAGHRDSVSGTGDLQLGGKFALSSGGGAMPAVTLIGYVTAPTGSRNFSGGRPAYNLNAVASWSLTGSTSFTTMASFTRAPADRDRHANSGTLAVSLSHSFTSHLTAYAETGRFPGYTNTSSTALAGGGMTYLLTGHVQVDGFFDVGLNRDSPTSVFGTGVSILF
ncbi:MAG: transporter [Rhodanobacter sp.]